MGSLTLLIDGDLLVYKMCSACQQEIHWGDGIRSLHIREQDVAAGIESAVDLYLGECEANDVIMAFSSYENFRKDILPEYKGNRGASKPIGYLWAREFCDKQYNTMEVKGIEADDILGILSTQKGPHNAIVVSEDKDLRQIPGRLFNPRTLQLDTIDVEEGDNYHLFQCLVGDRSDNYRGCPGVGEIKARAILDGAERDGDLSPWDAVVGAFGKAGLTEQDALVQARVARILRVEDWDAKKKEPILWEPK